jgi:branched-chain amino acid transport system permease protein
MVEDHANDLRRKRIVWLVLVSILLVTVLSPLVTGGPLSFYFYVMLWVTMASAMNVMAGFTGYIPFGFVAFYGIGAYATAIGVAKLGLPPILALVLAAFAGASVSLLFSPTLRLKGIYFAMVSLALAMICKLMISEVPESISGGSFGIVLASSNNPFAAYVAMASVMAATLVAAYVISFSRLGIALRAIRDDSEAAEILGVNVGRSRLLAWLCAGTSGALVGGVEAWFTNIVDPEASFNILVSAKSLIYAMAGGLGTLSGPIVGAVSMMFIDDFIWQRFPLFNLFFLGAVIVALMLFLPRGIVGTIAAKWPNLRRFIP